MIRDLISNVVIAGRNTYKRRKKGFNTLLTFGYGGLEVGGKRLLMLKAQTWRVSIRLVGLMIW
jgi:hypothetical protein